MSPEYYSRDIVQRCQELIDKVTSHRMDDRLEFTFLLAMAPPMIVLPVERMMKPMRPHSRTTFEVSAVDPAFDFNAEFAWTNVGEINAGHDSALHRRSGAVSWADECQGHRA